MFLCSNQHKIVNFYKPWSNMKILMLFHDFDVIDMLFHDFDVIHLSIMLFLLQTIYTMDLTHELILTNSSFGFVGLNKLIRKIHGIYNT